MKTIIAFMLFSTVAFAQSKTWSGTSSLMWPAQAPSALIIANTGTNTITINNTNSYSSTPNLFRIQNQSTNLWELSRRNVLYVGQGARSFWGEGYPPGIQFYANPTLNPDGDNSIQIEGQADDGVGNNGYFAIDTSTGRSAISLSTGSGYNFRTYVGNSAVEINATGPLGDTVWLRPTDATIPFRLYTGSTTPHESGTFFDVQNNGTNVLSASFDGAITTGDPGAGAGNWKLGTKVTGATVTLVTTNYVEVNINGTVVKLAIVQ